jgi:hypothetical protein
MMKKIIYFGSVAVVLAFALIYVSVANAQNVTTNASNAMGNASGNASQMAGNATNKTGGLLGGLGEKLKEAIGGNTTK